MVPLILNLVTRLSDQLHAPAALLSAIEPPKLGPRGGLETVEKRLKFCPCQEMNRCFSVIRVGAQSLRIV